jgi:hypothetical protein
MAARHETQDDMISWCDLADCGADALDNPRAFVPEDDRERNWVHLITNDEVRVAHAGRDNPQHNFVGARFVYRQRLDLKRPAFLADHGSLDLIASDEGRISHFISRILI